MNNKGADQTADLVFAFIICMQQSQVFQHRGPYGIDFENVLTKYHFIGFRQEMYALASYKAFNDFSFTLCLLVVNAVVCC